MNHKYRIVALTLMLPVLLNAQMHTDQNGWKSSVSNAVSASNTQAMRYEIAALGYNSHHWQMGGLIFIELFHQFYATGYAKYVTENGYGQGTGNTAPVIRLVETYGALSLAKVTLGTPTDLTTNISGYPNRRLSLYVDVRNYGSYRVRITYFQERVEEVTSHNQLSFFAAPTGTPIPDFTVPAVPNRDLAGSGNLKITGPGAHYIENGNLGIGNIGPVATLHVGKRESSTLSAEAGIDRIAIQPYYHTGGPWFISARDNPSKGYLDIRYGANKIFTMDHTGNIGIGAVNLNEKLSVNGRIRAKEIKVEQNNWPDYVFKKGYRLPSLAEVEKHIKEKGHLPEVPSAKEVEKEGIALGANQVVLLKKIEELTLYLIEKDKQLIQQKRLNEDLEKRLKRVESALHVTNK